MNQSWTGEVYTTPLCSCTQQSSMSHMIKSTMKRWGGCNAHGTGCCAPCTGWSRAASVCPPGESLTWNFSWYNTLDGGIWVFQHETLRPKVQTIENVAPYPPNGSFPESCQPSNCNKFRNHPFSFPGLTFQEIFIPKHFNTVSAGQTWRLHVTTPTHLSLNRLSKVWNFSNFMAVPQRDSQWHSGLNRATFSWVMELSRLASSARVLTFRRPEVGAVFRDSIEEKILQNFHLLYVSLSTVGSLLTGFFVHLPTSHTQLFPPDTCLQIPKPPDTVSPLRCSVASSLASRLMRYSFCKSGILGSHFRVSLGRRTVLFARFLGCSGLEEPRKPQKRVLLEINFKLVAKKH